MNLYKNENSLNNKISHNYKKNSNNISLFNIKLVHKIFDSLNLSLLILIFFLSSLSFSSQRKWTNYYRNLVKTIAKNNNLIDYISKTEEFYTHEIEFLDAFKKTTPQDLIYLDKQIIKKKNNNFIRTIRYIHNGLKDSRYQIGY